MLEKIQRPSNLMVGVVAALLIAVFSGTLSGQTPEDSTKVAPAKPTGKVIQIRLPSFFATGNDTTPKAPKVGRFDCSERWQNSKFLKENQLGLFQSYGISIYKYDWKDAQMNCDVNLAAKHFQRGGVFKGFGLVLLGSGLGLAAAGVIDLASYGSGIPLVFGSLLTVGSIPLFIARSSEKRKMERHLNAVAQYFRANNL